MRNMTFPILAGASIIMLWTASSPAQAHGHNYCLLGKNWGSAGSCVFFTFQQCLMSSRKTGFGCVVNPPIRFSQGRATIMLKIITSTERENPPQNINPRVEPNPSAIFRFPSAAEPCAALFPGGYLARPPLH
jgi:hypothetical protein